MTRFSALYLRPFRESESDVQLLIRNALTVKRLGGKLTVIGSEKEESSLGRAWEDQGPAFKGSFEKSINYIVCDPSNWKTVVISNIIRSRTILLHWAPKGDEFPESIYPILGPSNPYDDYMNSPLSESVTGAGLLLELSYLNRTQSFGRTIVLMEARRREDYNRDISFYHPHGTFVFKNSGEMEESVLPRRSMLDRQMQGLQEVRRVITYSMGLGGRPGSLRYELKLAAALILMANKRAVARSETELKMLMGRLSGVSDKPREIDLLGNGPKILSATPAESLVVLKDYSLREFDRFHAGSKLTRKAREGGCPVCKASFEEIFFFTQGLEAPGDRMIKAHCQQCGAYLGIKQAQIVEV